VLTKVQPSPFLQECYQAFEVTTAAQRHFRPRRCVTVATPCAERRTRILRVRVSAERRPLLSFAKALECWRMARRGDGSPRARGDTLRDRTFAQPPVYS
jgi:hypothetical protein